MRRSPNQPKTRRPYSARFAALATVSSWRTYAASRRDVSRPTPARAAWLRSNVRRNPPDDLRAIVTRGREGHDDATDWRFHDPHGAQSRAQERLLTDVREGGLHPRTLS